MRLVRRVRGLGREAAEGSCVRERVMGRRYGWMKRGVVMEGELGERSGVGGWTAQWPGIMQPMLERQVWGRCGAVIDKAQEVLRL